MSARAWQREDPVIDRLCELANIGAGHAAGALGQLLGCPIVMAAPRLEAPRPEANPDGFAVCFDVQGEPGGTLAVLVPESEMDALLEALLGAPDVDRADQVESALIEVGNILVSHALSAVADTIGAAVIPSIPRAPREAAPDAGRPCIETDLFDRDGRLRSTLLWIPAPEAS